jgi:integrase
VVKHQADQAVDGPRVPDADIIPLSPADATRLLEAARGHQYEDMFALLLTTGLRRWPARRGGSRAGLLHKPSGTSEALQS